jgi:hypothetical protein
MAVICLINKFVFQLCLILLVLVSQLFPQYLGIEKFHQVLAIELSVRYLGLVWECSISCLPDSVRLSPLHGSAFNQVTIFFLCLLISK